MLVVAGRSRAGGGSIPNGEHEHQLGQRGRRGPGCTARSRAGAALLADGGDGGCEVQVELQRAIHPDDGGSGVGE
jgi:hypothetical protein